MSAGADLVLAGAGHAHLHVLEALAARPDLAARTLLVTESPGSVYSGMVPGVIAGQYPLDAVLLPAAALARSAGIEVRIARVAGVDPAARRLRLDGGESVDFGILSLNLGSTVAGLDLPGVRAHTLATRPIGAFVRELEARLRDRSRTPRRAVIVGAGAAGVELAFAIRARTAAAGAPAHITLVHGGLEILPGSPPGLIRRVRRAARRRGIVLRTDASVEAVSADGVHVQGGGSLPADLVLWATGAAAHPLLAESGLPVDGRGFLRVRATLQVDGDDAIFAAGDSAVPEPRPDLPRAGVHAVRQGPPLARNLMALLDGGRPESYTPQRDVLVLLNLGDGTAAGSKWGRAFQGRAVLWLKDRIDRRFMARFSRIG
ncbi:MAG: FAD-dependent oxidoreductase [Longimicrobiales bacterium]|nr:FAD-dependent oxidoreductase [Longimicrobiales bacterium]